MQTEAAPPDPYASGAAVVVEAQIDLDAGAERRHVDEGRGAQRQWKRISRKEDVGALPHACPSCGRQFEKPTGVRCHLKNNPGCSVAHAKAKLAARNQYV